jgi:hypothetical protein
MRRREVRVAPADRTVDPAFEGVAAHATMSRSPEKKATRATFSLARFVHV